MRSPSNPTDNPIKAHDRVYRSLRQTIMNGEIPPGRALTLRGIGAQFSVSMTPAREAVRRLVAEGALSLSASGRVTTPALTPERIEELTAIRALLEPELAARALPRVHPALIDRLRAINRAIKDTIIRQDAPGYIRSNMEFHRTIYLRAQAPAMLAVTETVWLQLSPTMCGLYENRNRRDQASNHQMIIAALSCADEPNLRAAVQSDVTQGLKMLVD